MGIDTFSTRFLLDGGVCGSVLTIGRQALFGDNRDYARMLGVSVSQFESIRAEGEGFSEGLLRHLGATSVDSLDYSTYEKASILHDLNEPVPSTLHKRFETVIDAGSLEHVFNYPIALRNCMEMVKQRGRLVIITPCNNYCGHGFYQPGPELFFRAFAKENGYEVTSAFLRVGVGEDEPEIFHLADPGVDGKRREISTMEQTLLYVEARRVEITCLFRKWPQQSDYVATWAAS